MYICIYISNKYNFYYKILSPNKKKGTMSMYTLLGSNRAYKHDMDKQNAADNKKIASPSYKPYSCFRRDIKDLSYIILYGIKKYTFGCCR